MAEPEATTDPEAEAAPSGGAKAKLPMIAMVVVGLALGGGTGVVVVGPLVAKSMGKVAAPVSDSAAAHADGAEADAHAAAGEKGAAGDATVHLIEDLVMNPANSGGGRFLLLSVAIETETAAIAADMTTRDAELRDIVLTALGSKTVEQLTDMNIRDSIKLELQTAVSERFGKKSVKRLYFPQFVVQ